MKRGSTKIIAVLGGLGLIGDRGEFATAAFKESVSRARQIFSDRHSAHLVAAYGTDAFHPMRLNLSAADHGAILALSDVGRSTLPNRDMKRRRAGEELPQTNDSAGP